MDGVERDLHRHANRHPAGHIRGASGVISDEKLINGYRRFGSVLQGHPTPVLPWIDVATGSLGQGLPMARSIRRSPTRPKRIGRP